MKLLPIPKEVLTTPVTVTIETGQTRTGEAASTIIWTGLCRLVEKMEHHYDTEKRLITLPGHIYLGTDPAPGTPLEGGTVAIGTQTWSIFRGERMRNPDGTVHHVKVILR